MTTSNQDKQFIKDVIPGALLEECIIWIRDNLEPDEVFTDDQLEEWAEDNGFVEEE